MATFKEGDKVRLKLQVAKKLQETYGKNNPYYQQLVGCVGTLQESPNAEMDFLFVTLRKRFGVKAHEIEAVELKGNE